MSILKDHQFNSYCHILKLGSQPVNNPDRKVIEKAFRKLALKTHPDKVNKALKIQAILHIFIVLDRVEIQLSSRKSMMPTTNSLVMSPLWRPLRPRLKCRERLLSLKSPNRLFQSGRTNSRLFMDFLELAKSTIPSLV